MVIPYADLNTHKETVLAIFTTLQLYYLVPVSKNNSMVIYVEINGDTMNDILKFKI